ncbi:transcription factor BIM2 isoform X2 [Arabidopsis lyrata subsp. lyrata]|uniref:transcription factor BIM2 isoform X2 n=1 Tax=Arabidopsis lyrata subsp. lyrata TaxID=81972 RepID=UPI000A29D60A|nr:transcription factor BIM2 isoform X2 [Arabidopsis lyrata subsp. lyrata]|eukprot:XP_020890490.1 transcription factor BIM2 isoform X2 [Arabidopsis lyrata subsp. lyrata]
MRTGKGNQEEEDYGEEDFSSKREGPSSNTTVHSNNNNNRDSKENDKASAIRSKHSVTEQRRRSKINERFQILRELIPNSEQKRDTASFLLEVIDYVQYLQEKVQKYEGSYPGWSQEPTKLTPWRNNHWRVQSLANHPVAINNGSGPGIPFPGKFEENTVTSTPAIVAEPQIPIESDKGRAITGISIESQPELDDKGLPPLQPILPMVQGEQANECPATSDGLRQSNDLVIEGGTISISSAYSHELLNSLTQALQNAGIDLSHAKLSVQIDLGKRANQGLTHDEPSKSIII